METTDSKGVNVEHENSSVEVFVNEEKLQHQRTQSAPSSPSHTAPPDYSRQSTPLHGNGNGSNKHANTQNNTRPTATVGPAAFRRSTSIDNSSLEKVDRDKALENSMVTKGAVGAAVAATAPTIEEGSPAAEALRANAEVQVTKLDKLARAMGTQSVKRMGKRVTHAVQLKSSSGNKRGKPPRVPPGYDPEHRKSPAGPGGGVVDDTILGDIGAHGDIPHLDTLQEIDDEKSSYESAAEEETKSAPGRVATASVPVPLVVTPISQKIMGPVPTEISLHDDSEVPNNILVGPDVDIHGVEGDDFGLSDSEKQEDIDGKGPLILGGSDHADNHRKHGSSGHHTSFSERRRRRRRKKESEKNRRKSYVKGKVIDGEHELYTLSIAVMLGLRTSIGMTNSQLSNSADKRIWLEEDDFRAVQKYVFRPKGGPRTPPHQLSHTFKFKDYSPLAFAYIRRMFGINEYEFLLSVCGNANLIEFISNAKSGQFFFYSSDGKYMIKTMTNAESKFLRRILPHYFRHCAQNPNTLITKFLGMYRVKMYHLRRNVKFVIMNSVFDTDKFLQSFYDLKGSKIGRDAKPGEDVKKDNDVRRGLPGSAFALPPVVRQRMRKQIEADCAFFKEMKIMDYSMLIGVHHVPLKRANSISSAARSATGFRDQCSTRRDASSIRELLGKRANAVHHMPPLPFPLIPTDSERDSTTTGDAVRNHNHTNFPNPRQESKTEVETDEDSLDTANRQRGGKMNSRVNSKRSPASSMPLSPRLYHTDSPSIEDKLLLDAQGDLSVASFNTFDHYYDDDDDCSYLDGAASSQRHANDIQRTASADSEADESHLRKLEGVELKREDATEQMYWPFHRLYDLQGRRRMVPLSLKKSTKVSDGNEKEKEVKWKLPDFVTPISDRKDAGLMMDVSGMELPIKLEGMGRIQFCEGKIFYMGIIDVLQQFNIRKRLEARWRRLHGGGWGDASCVHPNLYADRFLLFFDEYSNKEFEGAEEKAGKAESDDASDSDDGVEEITFYEDDGKPNQEIKGPMNSGVPVNQHSTDKVASTEYSKSKTD